MAAGLMEEAMISMEAAVVVVDTTTRATEGDMVETKVGTYNTIKRATKCIY